MTEWILSSCVLILVVVLLRQLLKGKLSLRLQYALWALVLIRLLVPFSFGVSKFSVTNAVREVQTQRQEGEIVIADPPSKWPNTEWMPESAIAEPDPSLPEEEWEQQYLENKQQWQEEQDAAWEEYKAENTEYVTLSVSHILRTVWIAGMAAMTLWLLVTNLRFWLRLRRSRRVLNYMPLMTYVSGAVETPCLFGLFKPAIYVTPEVAEDEVAMAHVLAHETTHYRHKDYIWSVLRCVCLVLHWYNPLVWLAAALSRRDAELACDESTLRRIGEGERAAYGRTLIGLTCTRKGGLLQTATTMTGSKKSIKERIKLIAKKPNMKLYTLIAVLLIAAVAVSCTYTGSASISGWAEDLTVEELEGTVKLTDIRGGKNYPLSEADREELLTILRGIDNDQILKNVPAEAMEPGKYNYDYTLSYSTGNDVQVLSSISFSFLDNGAIGVNCFGDLGYLTGLGSEWKWLDSPELYRFMADRFALPEVSDADNVSFAAMHYAHQVIEEHLTALQVQGIDAELYNVQALHSESTGTAGANTSSVEPPSLEVYRLSYCLDGLEGDYYGSFANFTKYLFIFVADGKSTLVKTADMVSLSEEYLSTPEMQEKYNGNTLVAAAIELFEDCMEERNAGGEPSVLPSAPVSPSDGLYQIAKRGDNASVTLYTAQEGERSTFVLDYKSDAWKNTNNLIGTQWMVLSEAPEGQWDYWLTYASADGAVTVTFYAGKDGPVKYEDGERTVWWQVRPNFWNGRSNAEDLRASVYDLLESGWQNIPAFESSGQEAGAEEFARRYGQLLVNATPGSVLHAMECEVEQVELKQVSDDRKLLSASMTYYVLPESWRNGFLVGGAQEGTGEYEGWVLLYREFVLELREDSKWYCIDFGTEVMDLDEYSSAEGRMELYVPDIPTNGLYNITKRGETATLTLYTAQLGQRNSYTFDFESYYWKRLNTLFYGSGSTKLDQPPEGDREFWLTFTSEDGGVSVTFYSGGDGLVCYTDEKNTLWWTMKPDQWDYLVCAENLRAEIYDNLEVGASSIPAFSAPSAYEAGMQFATLEYGEHLKNLTPGNMYRILDYDVLSASAGQISVNDDAVAGGVRLAFLPENYDSPGLWAGNTTEGTGEYEGWLVVGREFILERQEDGLWRCRGIGTGGYRLSNLGYKIAGTPENPAVALEEMLETDGHIYLAWYTDRGDPYTMVDSGYNPRYETDPLLTLLKNAEWTPVEDSPEGAETDVVIFSADKAGDSFLEFCLVEEAYVRFYSQSRGISVWWKTAAGSFEETLTECYNMCPYAWQGRFVPNSSDMDAAEAAEAVVQYLGEVQLGLKPGNVFRITDYAVVEQEVYISPDGNHVAVGLQYAFIPAGDLNYFASGNLWEGEGEYEGWWLKYGEIGLDRDENGLWYIRGMATGGYISMFKEQYNLPD